MNLGAGVGSNLHMGMKMLLTVAHIYVNKHTHFAIVSFTRLNIYLFVYLNT